MRLQIVKSKNAASFYVIKTVYKDGKQKTIIVKKLGTYASLLEKLNGEDPYEWARKQVDELNQKEQEEKHEDVHITLSPDKKIKSGEKRLFNGGFLFLSRIYKQLGLNKLCKQISRNYKFRYNLDSILSRLIYSRIIYPDSKLATFELSKKFIEQPDFDLHQIYRALDVLCKESELIQSTVYENSLKIVPRDTRVLFYDCTNFYFEMEQEAGIRQYGYSKEHRPNPIVQMGLFMDGNGIPLSFCINPGNTNEQVTMRPLEKKIIDDFGISKFIVCTDAGLASEDNRRFNTKGDRAFITTQSIKKLKGFLKEWCLDNDGWNLTGSSKKYSLTSIDEDKYKESTFYKERWINENGLEQKLIVTYSIKYRDYMRTLRERQINRAENLINTKSDKLKKASPNDCKRFISQINCTSTGEIADKSFYSLNYETIEDEAKYDGFYAVCTNIQDDTADIIKINKKRWEIEECFRIMKTEFKSRPVYLSDDDRIRAHFLTCYLALLIFRLLEKKLDDKFTCEQIIDAIREYNFLEIQKKGYIPAYECSEIYDSLHDIFGFYNDKEIISYDQMNKIIKS
ncbi:MAG: IS1634 family transposase, partial [Treponema sp.]|nr:IS1634 family transposase [Treponema sp.]